MANSLSNSYPAIWSKYMARTLDIIAKILPLVDRSVEGDLAQYGNVVHVQKYGSVTISDYTEGSDMSVQDVSITDDTLTLDQKKYFDIIIEATEQAQSHLDLVKGWQKRGAIAMGIVMDTRLLSHYADVDSGNVIGTNGAPITLTKDNIVDQFIQARKLLQLVNVPIEDGVVAVIDPATEALLLNNPLFVRSTPMGDQTVSKGEIGTVVGFKVVVSNNIATVSGVMNLMFFHREFISFALRISPDKVEIYKPEKRFGTGIKALAFYGSHVFNPKMGVVLKKAA